MALRRALHAMGLRYWVDRPPLTDLRRRADLVFPRARVAVYIDGCFWHSCPEHGTSPKASGAWWRAKLEANRARDADTDRRLDEAGWMTLRVWEHENPVVAAHRVAEALALRRLPPGAAGGPPARCPVGSSRTTRLQTAGPCAAWPSGLEPS
jgi:DNA mismatch endonuclease (patch repair protein)